MKPPHGPRQVASHPSEAVHHRLNMYVLAASATGVGALALSSPAEAKIVYTPAHVVLGFSGYNLDLNHDGITDFGFSFGYGCRSSTCNYGFWVGPFPSNAVAGKNGPAALWPGVVIGPKRRFWEGSGNIERVVWRFFGSGRGSTAKFYGQWANGVSGKGFKGHYLGLKFIINGRVHYGWARMNTIDPGRWPNVVLTGYAYETIPGKAIKAGQIEGMAESPTLNRDSANPDDPGPGSSLTSPIPDTPHPAALGMLALGAQGVPLWRRKESALEGD